MKRLPILAALICVLAALCAGCGDKKAAPTAALPDPAHATYAVLVGTTSEKIVDERYPNAVKLPFDSVNDAVLALLAGKADYVVTAYTNCVNFIRANPQRLAMLPDKLTDEGTGIAVNKSETELLRDIDRVLEQFRQDGTLAQIVSNWVREDGLDYVRAELPVLESGPVLHVAVSAEREPMCFVENGEIIGLDAELITRIAYELGMRVAFSDMKFSAMIPSVLSGKTPVAISNIAATEERRESVNFSSTYFTNPQMFLMRAEFSEPPAPSATHAKLNDLAGKRIGVTTGAIFDQAARKQWPDAKLLYFETLSDQIIALQQDKIDAFLTDEPVGRQITLNTPGLSMLDERLMQDQYGFAFQKNEAGEQLCNAFNAFMHTSGDGKLLEQLDEIWFGADETKKTVIAADTLPATNGVVRFAATMETAPFNYLKDGRPVGTEIDLITRFCKEAGYGLEIETVSFGALLPGLVSNRYDAVASSISITEERAKSVRFSDPFYLGGMVAVVPDASASSGSAVPVETARIGAQTGTSFEGVALDRFPNAKYSSFSTLDSCMLALKSGQIDYAVMADLDTKHYQTVDANYKIVEPPLKTITVCAAISKDKPELKERIDALLNQYEKDGLLDRLFANWLEVENFEYIREEVPVRTEGETLRVVMTSASEPSSFMWNGELCGYDIELVRHLAYDMGMQVEFVDVNSAAMVPTLAAGKGDVILCGLTYTEERAEKVLFSRPYITLSTVLACYDASGDSEKADFFTAFSNSFRKNFLVESRWKMIVSGVGVTLLLSVCAGIVGIIIGFGFCLLRMSRANALCACVSAVTRILQGTPMVVLLMILYYVVFNKTGLNGVAVSIIAFGLNFGAYASEIMLSGVNAVDGGQREAAAAMGFSPAQTFGKIVFPQAARHFLPVLKGEYISLVKMTSIVGYVAVQDLTKVSDIIRSRTYEAFFPLIVTAIIYFLLSFGLSSLLKFIEIRIDPKRRARTLKGVELQ